MQELIIHLINQCKMQGKEPMIITVPIDWYIRLQDELQTMLVYGVSTARYPYNSVVFCGVQINPGGSTLHIEFMSTSSIRRETD